MSESGKKIAKWCWIILGVCVVVGLFLCVVNESILFYCLRHIKDSILILLCCLLLSLLYFKRYMGVCGLLLYFGFVVFFDANLDYWASSEYLLLEMQIVPFIVAFNVFVPIVLVYWGIIWIKRYFKGTKEDGNE